MNRAKTKNQPVEESKKDKGTRSTSPLEGSQEIPKKNDTIEIRDEANETEEKSSNADSKDPEEATSEPHKKAQDVDATTLIAGDSTGQSAEEPEPESEEEEEEEGEIELTTPRKTKSKGRKTNKEVRDQATYKDKMLGSQITLEKLLMNPRNTRQKGQAQKGMPTSSKSK